MTFVIFPSVQPSSLSVGVMLFLSAAAVEDE